MLFIGNFVSITRYRFQARFIRLLKLSIVNTLHKKCFYILIIFFRTSNKLQWYYSLSIHYTRDLIDLSELFFVKNLFVSLAHKSGACNLTSSVKVYKLSKHCQVSKFWLLGKKYHGWYLLIWIYGIYNCDNAIIIMIIGFARTICIA